MASAHNKFLVEETDFTQPGSRIDLDGVVASQEDYKKFVFGCRASGTMLPFADAWFDGYASNLVL